MGQLTIGVGRRRRCCEAVRMTASTPRLGKARRSTPRLTKMPTHPGERTGSVRTGRTQLVSPPSVPMTTQDGTHVAPRAVHPPLVRFLSLIRTDAHGALRRAHSGLIAAHSRLRRSVPGVDGQHPPPGVGDEHRQRGGELVEGGPLVFLESLSKERYRCRHQVALARDRGSIHSIGVRRYRDRQQPAIRKRTR